MKTRLAEVADQIQTVWAPLFMKELREKHLLAGLVNKDYQGEIRKRNDTVTVSQINAPKTTLRTVGSNADSFEANKLETVKIDVKADKRATSAYEFEDLIEIQSIIDMESPAVRESMMFDIAKQINDYLYSLVLPINSTTPKAVTRVITGVTDFNATQMKTLRNAAAKSLWGKDKGWWVLADPQYYGDLLNAITLTSSDHVDDRPVVGGNIGTKRFGFNIMEDDSRPDDFALAFHPDFLLYVEQTEVQFKISDLHSQKQFGFVMSADLVFGAKQGINGNLKHITVGN